MKLESLQPQVVVHGVIPDQGVSVVKADWLDSDALELTYKVPDGRVDVVLLYRSAEADLEVEAAGRPWGFDGDGELFRLVSEARRIRLAHLFDPLLAVHVSRVEPLPHQITAVYESMLPRQPLRFLLADDPGAGKTIMAGLLIKELIARGDVQRCLVVCPGSLAEQWQNEMHRRFHLPFEILTRERLETAHTGNAFLEHDRMIARLDQLARSEEVCDKLKAPDCHWDLVVCDEAHKMSATFAGGDVKFTKRYRLGQLLSTLTRHFLLMTATPHNGKEEDFQLFMALLDADRFAGRFREGTHRADVSDLMRRMVKEDLRKFDGGPLFPRRIAYTMPYQLSEDEARLYQAVTNYVREEFNRAEALENHRRAGTVGFALTLLQRRLASSPAAIYRSLRRRRERLQDRLEALQHSVPDVSQALSSEPVLEAEELEDLEEDLEDAPEQELEKLEAQLLGQATAARSITELQAELATLERLEKLAREVRDSGLDTKWRELAQLLNELFVEEGEVGGVAEQAPPYGSGEIPKPVSSPRQKLVLFTEHRDTLEYLRRRVTTLIGRERAVTMIHGGLGREQRRRAEEEFRHDPEVQVLLATDAAGEGINLQRAHLMVNYDLPWNPNRLEQRFGRIHRIGQNEVCYLWNLVAKQTREGDVYDTLLRKLEQARRSLGGKVFDVLGKLQFEGRSLRDLLLQAIRYGEQPEVRSLITDAVQQAMERSRLEQLLEDQALARDAMDASRVCRIREDMERAEARRLQPHYIESFFQEAFQRLGGVMKQRETRRYEISRVPAQLRERRPNGNDPVLARYERVAFEKGLLEAQPMAAFLCPGHPLLDAVLDLTLERHQALLQRGAVLIDTLDPGTRPRVIFSLDHAVQDAGFKRSGERRVISRRVLYVALDESGACRQVHCAPYLDYRPLEQEEPKASEILARPECAWIGPDLEQQVKRYAVNEIVPGHLQEVQQAKLELLQKTKKAVQERLTKEISYWDRRAEQLRSREQQGKTGARLNSHEARKRADQLQARRDKRMEELQREAKITPRPPVVTGGFLVVPLGLIRTMSGKKAPPPAKDTLQAAARARTAVMQTEQKLGYQPTDREHEKLGYDIESKIPATGKLRFIEVKGRTSEAKTITVTRNEILCSLNKPEDFILALVQFLPDNTTSVHYLRNPFHREPDFGVTSVNYDFNKLLAKAHPPS